MGSGRRFSDLLSVRLGAAMAAVLALSLAAVLVLLLLRGAHVLRWLALYLRACYLLRNQPGPRAYPIIGNFLTIAGPHKDVYRKMKDLLYAYPDGFRFWLGPVPFVVVLDPDDLEMFFTSPHLSGKYELAYNTLEPIIGMGLINMNGPDYKRHRKAITNSMHLDILQEFVQTFSENAGRLVSSLEALAESGEVFDCTPLMGRCATNTVCETVLSTDLVDQEAKWDDFVSVSHQASKLMLQRCIRPWCYSDTLFPLFPLYKEYHRLSEGMNAFVSKVLNRKMDQIKTESVPKRRRHAFLDHVLQSEDEVGILSKDELFSELKTLLFAASSTSMDFLSLFFVCVSQLPDIQEKMHKELDEVFGSEVDRAVLPPDLPHLQYLELVLKEVLRLFPPVCIFVRVATEDVFLPSGLVIPRGVPAAVLPAFTHRNGRHFPDPLRFDPDRFLPENSRGRHPFAYVPFSAGSRNCIGQRYGLMFAKTVTCTVLRRFRVLPDPAGPKDLEDLPIEVGISMAVQGGARIRLQRRHHKDSSASSAADTGGHVTALLGSHRHKTFSSGKSMA